jgi:hypothetical protein
MKKIAILLCFVILMTCFSGCGQNGSTLSPENPVTLTMWHVDGSQTKSPLNDVINEFNQTVGKEKGITINVESVTSSSAIDKALSASANGEPGADTMPDLFTAYPRVVELIGKDRLLSWDDYFSEKELSYFHKEFLSEGYFEEDLLMLPVAKSTEAFYLNKTLFDRFSTDTGVTVNGLNTFDGVFDAARKYYDWSNGQSFMQINDYYNYAYVGMKAYGSELIRNGRLRLDDDAFRTIWVPLAETAIYGGIGVCGQPLCCARFLKEFNSINVKMAKEQDLSLTPGTISGACGRLKCCLKFEYEGYLELEKGMPRKGEWCDTPQGKGRISDRNLLVRKVTVQLENGSAATFKCDEITVVRPPKKNNNNNPKNSK